MRRGGKKKHDIFKSSGLDGCSDWNRMEPSWENKQQKRSFLRLYKDTGREIQSSRESKTARKSLMPRFCNGKYTFSMQLCTVCWLLEWDLTNAWIYWHGLSLDEKPLKAPKIQSGYKRLARLYSTRSEAVAEIQHTVPYVCPVHVTHIIR